jgi:zinc transporter 1
MLPEVPEASTPNPADPDEPACLIEPANCQEFLNLLHTQAGAGHHDHDHSHVPEVSWRLLTMIGLNFFVFVAELVTGYITKSLSLQSDAWHMLSDEASLFIGYFAHRLSKRPPTSSMTFGWARTEVLGGLVNATFLLAVCLMIAFDAIERFIAPPDIEQPLLFLIVGGIGLVANIIGMFLFHNHSHSDNIRGVFLHVMGDFFGSIGVVATALIYYFTDWSFKKYVDPVFSLLIVAILVKGSVALFKKTSMTVVERCPDSINCDLIKQELLQIPGLLAVHELHIWELSKQHFLSTIHLVVESKDKNRPVLENVHNLMIQYGVYSSTVQIEFADDFPEGIDHMDHCFYASSLGARNRVFLTPPVYRHIIGCPHVNIPGEDFSDDLDEHDHDHHDHDHDHGHRHHDHDHHDQREHLVHDADSDGSSA